MPRNAKECQGAKKPHPSERGDTIIAIIAHYIDSSGAWKVNLIALRSLDGEHSRENMAALLLKVFREYKIGGYIGFFILDNASANNTYVDLVLQKLYPRMKAK